MDIEFHFLIHTSYLPVMRAVVKSGLRICGSADVDIDKIELNCIFRLRVSVRVGVRVRVSISIYLTAVIKLRIGSVLTNNIRRSANPQSAFYPWPSYALMAGPMYLMGFVVISVSRRHFVSV